MDVTNIDQAGQLNATPLVLECVENLVEMDSGPKGSDLFNIHFKEFGPSYAGAALCVLETLRKRGLLNELGIEQLRREGL